MTSVPSCDFGHLLRKGIASAQHQEPRIVQTLPSIECASALLCSSQACPLCSGQAPDCTKLQAPDGTTGDQAIPPPGRLLHNDGCEAEQRSDETYVLR
eukprot:CAMPEP_0174333190 /NCGR_PEP_ID=MMETSP0810-20121108/18934_1 /TAXON_ID=73025 ORGANISM="Eutreptiella gymnastica-like, Strain CCMP1594" /NCGR_SAMPLE_ID=MMETSP0810 /ASSEMBLY_ACC=CAM_ASM_000659 /LENGTH=97 /DNA_ID=CAMNT_0015450119 /DNA_START=31 /DNA_END=324 /DNA_ORIENTATION=+